MRDLWKIPCASFFLIVVSGAIVNAELDESDPPTEYEVESLVLLEGPVISTSGPNGMGQRASVSVDQATTQPARFAVAWETGVTSVTGGIPTYGYNQILIGRFDVSGASLYAADRVSNFIGPDGYPADDFDTDHNFPSIALSGNAKARVAWLGRSTIHGVSLIFGAPSLLKADFLFDRSSSGWPHVGPPLPANATDDHSTSAGVSNTTTVRSVTWCRNTDPVGLLYEKPPTPAIEVQESCSNYCYARVLQWQPCMTMRDDGYFLLCWSEAENEIVSDPPFNIMLQTFNSNGVAVGSPVTVNDTSVDPANSIQ